METRTFRAAPSAYLVFAGISLALEVLWLGAAWKSGAVTWAPVLLIAGLYVATVVWLTGFRLTLDAEALRIRLPFRPERRLARAEIVSVEFDARPDEPPFTLVFRLESGEELRLNAKLFTREAVRCLLALNPPPAARTARAA